MYRTLIVEAAERVFARRGYAGTKMQDVADEAGLAIATVYATIAGKEELYAAIHELRGRALLERAADAARNATSAFDALLIGVEAYARFLAEHPDYLRVHLNEAQPWALDPRFLCAEQKRQWRSGLELTVGVFRAAMAEGSVSEGDPELLARLMIAAHQVFLVHWVEHGMRDPIEALVEKMQNHVRRAFARQS
ncbi:MAG: TetR/AcrR family transcriptional regulator [Polyangiaceae bacterium]|nr:TetR/AcrR family transcriptional regulator [Polyangiaceae bacterium]